MSGADFSQADIRGTDFSNSILQNAKFKGATAGWSRRWEVKFFLGAALMVGVSGLILAIVWYVLSFISNYWNFDNFNFGIAAWIVVVVLLIMAIRNGIAKSVETVFFTLKVFAFVLSGVAFAFGLPLIFAFVVSFAFVVAFGSASPNIGAFTFTVTVAFALGGAFLGTLALEFAFDSIDVAAGIAITGAVTVAIAIVGLTASGFLFPLFGVYIGWRVIAGDKILVWTRSTAIAFAAMGGTSFRSADLTNADFTGAKLKSTDFRNAILIRTRLHDVWPRPLK